MIYIIVVLFLLSLTLQLRNLEAVDALRLKKLSKLRGVKVQEYWYTQKLDHFDPTNNITFQQLYYINDTYYKPGNPVIIYIGNESPLTEYWITLSSIMFYCKKYSALGVALEHRYYGKTQPFNELTINNLKYLTSRQAINDLATFQNYLSKKYNTGKWVAFGGSYGATLAGALRTKYPHAYAGVIADSAPLHVKLDYYEYNEVATQSILKAQNGEKCANTLKLGLSQVESYLLTNEGKIKIRNDFKLLNPIESNLDIQVFLDNLLDIFMGIIQYNKNYKGKTEIDVLCESFTISGDPYQLIVNYVVNNKITIVGNYNELINKLNDTKPQLDGMRSWIYQTCTEYGWYQTDKSKNQIFGSLITVDYFISKCKDVYGVYPTEEMLLETNNYYGDLNQQGTNIFWTNGGLDPWSILGLLESDNQDIFFIPSASHCSPRYEPTSNDIEGLVMARRVIDNRISKWIK